MQWRAILSICRAGTGEPDSILAWAELPCRKHRWMTERDTPFHYRPVGGAGTPPELPQPCGRNTAISNEGGDSKRRYPLDCVEMGGLIHTEGISSKHTSTDGSFHQLSRAVLLQQDQCANSSVSFRRHHAMIHARGKSVPIH